MNGFVLCAQQGAQEAQIIAVFILPTTTKNGRKLRMLSAVANYRILRIVFIWDILIQKENNTFMKMLFIDE